MISHPHALHGFPRLKGFFPFSLGTTSYIIPADILPNVRVLAPLVDDIELVLFEAPDISNIPSASLVGELAILGHDTETSYTVHLPTTYRAGAPNKHERQQFIDASLRIIERCSPLRPRAWILHLEGVEPESSPAHVETWAKHCRDTIAELLPLFDNSHVVAVENLRYPPEWHESLVQELGLSRCLDIGHAWLYSPDSWTALVTQFLPYSRVIHLHGVHDHRDHLSLAAGDITAQADLLRTLVRTSYTGIVTLEIFSESDFVSSLIRMADLWDKLS